MTQRYVFQTFFHAHRIRLADFVYGYSRDKGHIVKDRHAMKAAYELGRMVSTMAEDRFKWPKEFSSPIYRVVAKKYGISACPSENRFKE